MTVWLRLLLLASVPLATKLGMTIPVRESCSIVFAGDMMQHSAQIESAHRDGTTYYYKDCFSGIAPLVREADIAVCNLETPLGGAPYSGYPAFCAPDEFASAIHEAGFDVMLTANNHCLDRGGRGLLRTLDVLDSLGVRHLGTYRNQAERDSLHPLLIEQGNMRIALLNYTYGVNGLSVPAPCIVNLIDTVSMASDIHKARTMKADCIIVCIHWGDEYRLKPESGQENLARWLIANGADHVIGSHPHVIQPTVLMEDAGGSIARHVVAYSLGNFISNMSAPHTDTGTLLELHLSHFMSVTWLDSFSENRIRTIRPAQSGSPNYRLVLSEER